MIITNRLAKQRSRATIACAGCRARRTRCIIGEGQSGCDRCQRSGRPCVIRDDDDRKRPLTRAGLDSLLQRIDALEQTISEAGIPFPPGIQSQDKQPVSEGSSSSSTQSQRAMPTTSLSVSSAPGLLTSSLDADSSPSAQERFSVHEIGESAPDLLTGPDSVAANLRKNSKSSSHRIRTGSRTSFFGITTNYHIYSDVYHSKLFAISEAQNEQAREFLAGIPAHTHAYLMDRFWQCYNLVIQVVHKEAFEADRLVQGDTYYSSFLHMCILGIGYRYADREKHDVYKLAVPHRGSVMHQEAKKLVEHELKMPGGMPSIQALILLGDLESGVGNYNTGWLYAGMASRLCFDLGLNQDSTETDLVQLEIEVRKTVLWACVTIDRYWSLFLGRRTSMKWSDISLAAKDSPMQDCYPMGHRRRLETEIYEALIRLMELASRLTDGVHCEHHISDPSAYFLAAGLDLELRQWYSRLPDRLKWSTGKLEAAPSSYFILHQQYHALFILLYRPFIPDSTAATVRNDRESVSDIIVQVARKACFSHAVEVAQIMSTYRQNFDLKSMFVTGMQHAATAALALVESMPTIARQDQSETLVYLQCLTEFLYANALTYFPARVMSEILFKVIAEYRTKHARMSSIPAAGTQMTIQQAQAPPSLDMYESGHSHDTHSHDANDAIGHSSDPVIEQEYIPGGALCSEIPTRQDNLSQQWQDNREPVESAMGDALQNDNAGFDSEIWESIMEILSQPMEY